MVKPKPISDNAVLTTENDEQAEVRMLVDFGNKAAAIRVVQKKLGLDLKEAEAYVERL